MISGTQSSPRPGACGGVLLTKRMKKEEGHNKDTTSKVKVEGHNRDTTPKVTQLLSPWELCFSKFWRKIFLASCVIGVCIDPLFLYIPIINDDRKCLDIDQTIKIVALTLRTLTDFTYVLQLILRLKTAKSMAKVLKSSLKIGFPWFYLLVDILAMLPIPQVIVIKYISEISGSKSLTKRKLMNTLLLFQYLPRILRVYLSAKDLGRSFDLFTQLVWLKGFFNFFLYIIVGHVFGGLWYFHSILRETACWHHACKKDEAGCIPNHFTCSNPNPIRNLTYIKEFCPVDPSNSTVFDFGIFTDAIESRILGKTDFFIKFSRSFWWGVHTLSSFGQNLETSRSVEENFFAILISILGLLIFLYLVGNLQTYMQLATKKSEKAKKIVRKRVPEIDLYLSNVPHDKKKVIKQYLQRKIKEEEDFDVDQLLSLLPNDDNVNSDETFAKWVTNLRNMKKGKARKIKGKAELWTEINGIPKELKEKIMKYVHLRLQTKDVDIGCEDILHILPNALQLAVKKHLCSPLLKEVPLLKNLDESVYETIYSFLKPVTFTDGSYIIREGEPIDMMFFITQGVVWTFGSGTKRLQKNDYYGSKLLEWRLNYKSYDHFPISTANVKSHTKVEALALMAIDLDHVLTKCWPEFYHKYVQNKELVPEGLETFAANTLKRNFRKFVFQKKKERVISEHKSSDQVAVNMGERHA